MAGWGGPWSSVMRFLRLPWDAGPNEPRIVIGPFVPANLQAFYGSLGASVTAAILWYFNGTDYHYYAITDAGYVAVGSAQSGIGVAEYYRYFAQTSPGMLWEIARASPVEMVMGDPSFVASGAVTMRFHAASTITLNDNSSLDIGSDNASLFMSGQPTRIMTNNLSAVSSAGQAVTTVQTPLVGTTFSVDSFRPNALWTATVFFAFDITLGSTDNLACRFLVDGVQPGVPGFVRGQVTGNLPVFSRTYVGSFLLPGPHTFQLVISKNAAAGTQSARVSECGYDAFIYES